MKHTAELYKIVRRSNAITDRRSIKDIRRCLNKSSYAINEGSMWIIGNRRFIYYIIVDDSSIGNTLNFVLKHKDLLHNKVMWTRNKRIVEWMSTSTYRRGQQNKIRIDMTKSDTRVNV